MQKTRQRSVFWPIVLVAAGVLWLLGNLGVISGVQLGALLQLWPVVLIAIGLDLLLGRESQLISIVIGVGTIALIVILVLAGPSIGLAGNLDVTNDTYAEPVGDASAARIDLSFGVGDGTIQALGDSNNLFEADINHVGELEFNVTGEREKVIRLVQKETGPTFVPFGFFWPNNEQELRWEVGLSPRVPLNLSINNGVGRGEFDLSDTQLTALRVDGGVGEVNVTLPTQEDHYTVRANSGVGAFSLTFSGEASTDVNIDSGVGEVNITVPEGVAVRLEANTGIGGVNVPRSFNQVSGDNDDGVWETDNYDQADLQIKIVYKGGIGALNVRTN